MVGCKWFKKKKWWVHMKVTDYHHLLHKKVVTKCVIKFVLLELLGSYNTPLI